MPSSRRTPRGAGPRASTRPGQRAAARARIVSPAPAAAPPPRPRLTGRAAVLVLVVAVLAVSYASSMRAYFDQRAHMSDLRASIASSKANIEYLEREKQRWRDPAYVELQARRRFGWVMPGEIGFQVIDESGKPLAQGASLTDPDDAPEVDRPEWWQSVWSSVELAGKPEHVSQRAPAERIQPEPARRLGAGVARREP